MTFLPHTITKARESLSTWPRLLCAAAMLICSSAPLHAQWASGSGGSIYYNSGKVGIGTTAPGVPLSLGATGGAIKLATYDDGGNQFYGIGIGPGELTFGAAITPTGTPQMVLQWTGNVGIGTTNPTYPLSVNGTIQAKEVLVNTGWSDYVFDPGYPLRSLTDVAAYIKDNHHLPGIPSAAEVKEKGVSLGDMQSKLLAKVEELTLHLIQAEQKNRDLEERLDRLESRKDSQR